MALTMAPTSDNAGQNGDASTNPHPGRVILSSQYIPEEWVEAQLNRLFPDRAKELTSRFEGINFIETITDDLQMPAKTFEAACTFFHKLRLNHRGRDYMIQDAAIACVFLACKCEDTLKKSRDILCAAYNLKKPDDIRTADDKLFEKPSAIIIGLERQALEAIAFNFRVRYPQKAVVKILRKVLNFDEAENLLHVCFCMWADMYMTYLPLYQTTFGMAFVIVELASRVTGLHVDKLNSEQAVKPEQLSVKRIFIRQGLVALLDLYTQHHGKTRVGRMITLDKFIEIKIAVNKEIEDAGPRALPVAREPFPDTNDLHSIAPPASGSVTSRFMFDAGEAHHEQRIVQQYFGDEYEEVEVEVEEPITPPAPDRPRDRRGHGPGGHGPGGPGGYRGHGHGQGHHGGQGRRGSDGWGGRRDNRRRRGGGGGFY
ncbi:hypothetical protein BJ170DRAFT_651197 [Xylariales sp. AK1849]|nr:hypothetical protein BJ170DRAFT_651197 [Xylariales sp. AK1849]